MANNEGVADTDTFPPKYKQNAWAFGVDTALFQVAMGFISSTTVLPAYFLTLTGSEVIVGLVGGLISGAWLLPQLLVGSFVSRIPRKKPIVLRSFVLSRAMLLLMTLVIWCVDGQSPRLTLAVTLSGIFLFFLFDAISSVPWLDLLARCLPARRRGRILGIAQVLGGLGGIGAGMIVRFLLGDSSPWGFPRNYAVLFALSVIFFSVELVALTFIHEPKGLTVDQSTAPLRQVLASLPQILVKDRPFRWFNVVRLLSGFIGVAGAFYVLYAVQDLGFGMQDTGLFLSAQVVGSVASGLLMGAMHGRWGPLTHARLLIILSAMPPLLALCAGPLAAAFPQGLLHLYLLLYFFMGIYVGGLFWPFFNWILEYAPEEQRPAYIGLTNTLSAVVMLAPALGGWIVRAISYPAVFGLALLFAASAYMVSFRLPSTR